MNGLARVRHAGVDAAAAAVDSAGCALARRGFRPAGHALMHAAERLYGHADDIAFTASGFSSRQAWVDHLSARGGDRSA